MDVQSDVGHVVKMLDCDKPDEDAAMPEADLPGDESKTLQRPCLWLFFRLEQRSWIRNKPR